MDLYNLIISAKLSKGEGRDVSVDPLSVTENGTYTAPSGKAYSPVNVNVPNSYSASDEGKVVKNGALVSQTSTTKTANGTYDTTTNNQVVVNVPSVTPTGTISITENGTVDVSQYASADVNVSGGGGNVFEDFKNLLEGNGGTDANPLVITIPEGITAIKQRVFIAYGSIIDVVLPSTLTEIQEYVFANATGIRNITVKAETPPYLSPTAFKSSQVLAFYVPSASVEAYKHATNWRAFASIIQAIPE